MLTLLKDMVYHHCVSPDLTDFIFAAVVESWPVDSALCRMSKEQDLCKCYSDRLEVLVIHLFLKQGRNCQYEGDTFYLCKIVLNQE